MRPRALRALPAVAVTVGLPLAGAAFGFGCGDEERADPVPDLLGSSVPQGVPDGDSQAAADGPVPEGDAPTAADGAESKTLHVLFIGNSYTYVNDVPGILTRIAATAGMGPAIVTDSVVQAGATLRDHLGGGIAARRIAERTWTHVVLQDQSLEPAIFPSGFLSAAKELGDQVAAAGARSVWFVT